MRAEITPTVESVAGAVREVILGAVRIRLVEAEQSGAAPDVVRLDRRQAPTAEAYLQVHYPLSGGPVLPRLLRQLAGQEAEPGGRTAELLVENITGLIEQACADYVDRSRPRPAAADHSQLARDAMLLRIQDFARSRLADPALKPEMLARHHHISLRYLQKLFSEHGQSPASWIRDERLSRCSDELRDPRFAHLTVAAIAERSGLYGASHFNRLFRDRYGLTPGEYRRQPANLRIAA
ncbi:helix-turn-helix domain-containing protein [Streptomyces sp. NPDC092296]|uniref:helix-turn-helix domain-containing protein n=1 Tax=Streptomyces sp. NPDC092296 TaxID=3366012 RepID=UPI0037FC26AB